MRVEWLLLAAGWCRRPAINYQLNSPSNLPQSNLQVRWITFHSGYDFGYLLKLLTCASLPANEAEFFQLLKVALSHVCL